MEIGSIRYLEIDGQDVTAYLRTESTEDADTGAQTCRSAAQSLIKSNRSDRNDQEDSKIF
jgi:hypothetical protein